MPYVRWREDAENNEKLLENSHFGGKTRCGGEILNFSLNVFLGLNFGLKDSCGMENEDKSICTLL